jgi:hypothetical protein
MKNKLNIDLGNYYENDFSSRHAMAEEINRDTARILRERRNIYRELKKEMPKEEKPRLGSVTTETALNEVYARGFNQALSEVNKKLDKVFKI